LKDEICQRLPWLCNLWGEQGQGWDWGDIKANHHGCSAGASAPSRCDSAEYCTQACESKYQPIN
jgi:hypothetical protein